MVSQAATNQSLIKRKRNSPPYNLGQYENLVQPSGGIQIIFDSQTTFFDDMSIDIDSTAGKNAWPYLPFGYQLDPACTVLTLWSEIPGLVALGNLNTGVLVYEGTPELPNSFLSRFTLGGSFFEYSGNAVSMLPIQSLAQTADDNNLEPTSHNTSIEKIECAVIDTFSLSGMAELAKLCGVSRQALYDWRKPSSKPEKERIQRLYSLWDASRNWSSSGFPSPGAQLHMPILKNRSLYDYLSELHPNNEAISFIGHRLLVNSLG